MDGNPAGGPPMFTHSAISGLGFGVLRRNFSGRNDVISYTHRKLHPVKAGAPDAMSLHWRPNASRHDLLLPPTVPDALNDYTLLLRSFEKAASDVFGDTLDEIKSLLLHIKLAAIPALPLHASWERARSFALQQFVDKEGLPAILVQHAPPGHVAGLSSPHFHLLALSRPFDGGRWGPTTSLAVDGTRFPLAEAWEAMVG
jgi:hypothetical protein